MLVICTFGHHISIRIDYPVKFSNLMSLKKENNSLMIFARFMIFRYAYVVNDGIY